MKVYIAGKVTGLKPEEYRAKFKACKESILQHVPYGTEIVNPTDLCQDDWDWDKCMSVCIPELMNSDLLILMPDWVDSRGAKEEFDIATRNNIPVWYF